MTATADRPFMLVLSTERARDDARKFGIERVEEAVELAIVDGKKSTRDAIREAAPVYTAADEPLVQLFGITMRRVERASAAIEVADSIIGSRPLAAYDLKGPELKALRDDLRGWIRLCANLADQLGLSPM